MRCGPIKGLRSQVRVAWSIIFILLVAAFGMPAYYSSKSLEDITANNLADARQDAEIKEIRRQHSELLGLVKENRETNKDILGVLNQIRGRIDKSEYKR